MNWLKQKIDENRKFCRVLALAIGCNLIIIGLFALVSYSVKDITVTVNGQTAKYKTVKTSVDDMISGWGVTLDEKDVVKAVGKQAVHHLDELFVRIEGGDDDSNFHGIVFRLPVRVSRSR